MRKFILLSWMLAFVCQAESDIYSAHQRKAYKQALGLVALYYGIDHQIVRFNPIPGGVFELEVINTSTQQPRSLFLLADLEHLIEGRLLSSLSDDQHQQTIAPLKRLAAHNQQLNQQISQFKQNVKSISDLPVSSEGEDQASESVKAKPLVGRTAASYLKTPFEFNGKSGSPSVFATNEGLKDSYAALTQLHHLSWGHGEKTLYAFVDLNCPACRQAHAAIEANISPDDVTIHYIPVGILGQDSEAKASLVLAPNDNLERNEAFNYLFQTAKVGDLVDITIDRGVMDQGWQRYKDNTLAFLNLPRPVTPTFAVLSEQGPIIRPAVSVKQIQTMIDLAVEGGEHGE